MGVLLMLLTIGVVLLAICLLALSWFMKSGWLARFVASAVIVWVGIYAVLLLCFSLASEEKTLALNEPKEFCGFYLDCHLHAAVTNVQKTKTHNGKTANGDFYVVRMKIFSDAKRAELGLSGAKLYVVDENGRRYPRTEGAENPEPPFQQKIPAGGSFEKEVVFDLPTDVKNPRLDMSETIGVDKAIEAVLIGDEDSILHKRTRFKIEPPQQTVNLQEKS